MTHEKKRLIMDMELYGQTALVFKSLPKLKYELPEILDHWLV